MPRAAGKRENFGGTMTVFYLYLSPTFSELSALSAARTRFTRVQCQGLSVKYYWDMTGFVPMTEIIVPDIVFLSKCSLSAGKCRRPRRTTSYIFL